MPRGCLIGSLLQMVQAQPPPPAVFENSNATFSDLDIEYARYPDDASFVRFFEDTEHTVAAEESQVYCAMRMLTFGEAKLDPSCFSYFREYATSLSSSYQNDWVPCLSRSQRGVVQYVNLRAGPIVCVGPRIGVWQ